MNELTPQQRDALLAELKGLNDDLDSQSARTREIGRRIDEIGEILIGSLPDDVKAELRAAGIDITYKAGLEPEHVDGIGIHAATLLATRDPDPTDGEGPVDEDDLFLEQIWDASRAHEYAAADLEVQSGDLFELFGAAWRSLYAAGRARFWQHPDVRELLTGENAIPEYAEHGITIPDLSEMQPITDPLGPAEVIDLRDENGKIAVVLAVEFDDVLDHDRIGFREMLAERVTYEAPSLKAVDFKIIGQQDATLYLLVTADASAVEDYPDDVEPSGARAEHIRNEVESFVERLVAAGDMDSFEEVFGSRDPNFHVGSLDANRMEAIYLDYILEGDED